MTDFLLSFNFGKHDFPFFSPSVFYFHGII